MKAVQLCVIVVLVASTGNSSASPASHLQFDVGYRVVRAGTMNVAVWYPSSDREADYKYADNLRGRAAANGAVERNAQVPLVVFSHGYGGCGIQTVFFTEELARRGYIVAAPDHKDALVCTVTGKGSFQAVQTGQSFLEPQKWSAETSIDRREDLQSLITWMLQSQEFGSVIARERIGAVGHSLGGYAVLGMAGAWPGWRDTRIGAVLTFSPYAAPFLRDKRLESMRTPVMYQGAQGDWGITPSLRGKGGAFGFSIAPKYYVELRAGNHFVWTNLECGSKTVARCVATDKTARLINEYGIAFLDQYLKGDRTGLSKLNGSGVASFQRAP